MSADHINASVEAARQAAQNQASASPSQNTAVATQTQSTAVAMPTAGKKLSMDDLMIGQMVVDGWMKVSEDGLKVGEGSKYIEEFEGIIDMTEGVGYTPQLTVKYGNSPVNYVKTYDQASTNTGKSWSEELVRIAQIDPKARPYPSADVIITLEKDAGTLKAGQTVGYALATTSFKHFATFLKEVKAQGLEGARVHVKVGYIARDSKGNKWGEAKYTLIGPVAE